MIKKQLFVVLLDCLLIVVLTGCKKAPVNDLLEQHWQLLEITNLATSTTEKCQRMYYGITRMVTEVGRKKGMQDDTVYVARTIYQGEKTLILKDFKVGGYNTDAKVDATAEQLRPFGIINPQETTFHILKLTSRELIMESDYSRLVFKKF